MIKYDKDGNGSCNVNFLEKIMLRWDSERAESIKNSYVGKIKCIRNLDELNFESNIVFFNGENGSGKSTLLEAIALIYGMNPEGGPDFYMTSSYNDISNLVDIMRPSRVGYPDAKLFLRPECIYSLGISHDTDEDIRRGSGFVPWTDGRSLGQSVMKMFNRSLEYKSTLYILDEPETALSIRAQVDMLNKIIDAANHGSQFIISSHSPILMAAPGAQIYSFNADRIYETTFEETDAYKLTETLINCRTDIFKVQAQKRWETLNVG